MEWETPVPANGDGLELLGPEDGPVASPAGRPPFVIDDAGEEHLLLAGRADAGHPDSLVSDLPLNALLDFQGILAPQVGSGPNSTFSLWIQR